MMYTHIIIVNVLVFCFIFTMMKVLEVSIVVFFTLI